jgi:hypothetical protein
MQMKLRRFVGAGGGFRLARIVACSGESKYAMTNRHSGVDRRHVVAVANASLHFVI